MLKRTGRPIVVLAGVMLVAVAGAAQTNEVFSFADEGAVVTALAYSPALTLVVEGSSKQAVLLGADMERTEGFQLDLEDPSAAAWAGEDLWILEAATGTIYQVDPTTGERIRSIPAPKPSIESAWSYEGIAWDGEYLWVAYFAGFSSRLVRVDVTTGEEVSSMFADAHPRGIYSDGINLWVLCYNGESAPSVVDRRVIDRDIKKTIQSRSFIGKVDIRNPRGLAFDGEKFLTIDVETSSIKSFSLQVSE